jgi:asparagine synthase (glutamine-hydrolysing)
MCGIAGVIKIHDPQDGPPPPPLEAIPEAWLDILDESIKHRGPDGQGRFRDRAVREDGTVVDVALVHRRLSIIDHTGGHQPMVHDGEYLRPDLTYQPGETPIIASEVEPDKPLIAVVFNGCIYNHRELRTELEGQGYVFETDHSDTEVLVHSWSSWLPGWQRPALTRWLNGMYAVLFWDRKNGVLNARRDPFGEKPLQSYFAIDLATTVHCSSRTAFEKLPRSPFPDLDDSQILPKTTPFLPAWIRHGWRNQYDQSSWCRDVRPACDVPNRPEEPVLASHFGSTAWLSQSHEENALSTEQVDQLLRDAVVRRLESDVPLGCFLSGGIDSALIANYASVAMGNLRTFTVRMPDARFDESEYAQITAEHLGTDHSTLECDPDPAADLVGLIEQLGQPFGDSSLLPTYWVSRAARDVVKVALAGDGGDELFCGYQRHQAPDLIDKLPFGHKLIPLGLLPDRDQKSNQSKLRRLLGVARLPAASLGPELNAVFPRSDLLRLVREPTSDWDVIDALNALETRAMTARGWDVAEYLTGDLLRKTDTASMAVGLEVRCPFLDPKLAEAALRTPINILMPNGERKGLLKQVARKHLPDHIVDRPKQGFAIPIGEWFRNDYGGMRQLLYDHLHSADPFPGLAEAGVELNMKFVERMLREHDAAGVKSINPWHGRDHSQRLYVLLVLSIWAKWLDRFHKSANTSA